MGKHDHIKIDIDRLMNMHNYFNRLDGTKSETAKEIINEIERQVLTLINPDATGVQPHGNKSEIR